LRQPQTVNAAKAPYVVDTLIAPIQPDALIGLNFIWIFADGHRRFPDSEKPGVHLREYRICADGAFAAGGRSIAIETGGIRLKRTPSGGDQKSHKETILTMMCVPRLDPPQT
jgi:hypothetical protein